MCPEQESNQRHKDFQSFALPTELSGLILCILTRRLPLCQEGTFIFFDLIFSYMWRQTFFHSCLYLAF